MAYGRFAQSLGGDEVVADVEVESVRPARLHARRAGEVDHGIDAVEDRVEIDVEQVGDDVHARCVDSIEADALRVAAGQLLLDRSGDRS